MINLDINNKITKDIMEYYSYMNDPYVIRLYECMIELIIRHISIVNPQIANDEVAIIKSINELVKQHNILTVSKCYDTISNTYTKNIIEHLHILTIAPDRLILAILISLMEYTDKYLAERQDMIMTLVVDHMEDFEILKHSTNTELKENLKYYHEETE
jgi:hypothetical protein